MTGEIDSWVRKSEQKLKVQWIDDQTNSVEFLSSLLAKKFNMKLIKYENGKAPPKAKGMAAKRSYQTATTSGRYAYHTPFDGVDERPLSDKEIRVPYREGTEELIQVWEVRHPQAIAEDWRDGTNFKSTINLPPGKYNTLERMLFNVCLDIPFAKRCVSWMNERLPGNSKDADKRKTTLGEVVQFWGYMVAICQVPNEPVESMWRTKSAPGDLTPPPNFGVHGMTKNRFKKLRALQGMMYQEDEADLDPNDDWRYCRSVVDSFNDRRLKLVVPSYLLVADEAMSAWLGQEGVVPGVGANSKPIPFLSFIERKPEPLGM
ncbi:hypothetical protein AB1Y20_012531 [Prymnesium parvum]